MDLLDPVLDSLRLRSSIFARMELQGDWGFVKPKMEGSPFYIVTTGRCEIRLEDGETAVAGEGDLVILPTGDPHQLSSGPTAHLVSFKQVLAELGWDAWTPGMRYKTGVLQYQDGDGSSTTIIAGVFDFEDFSKNPLIFRLPKLLHLPHECRNAMANVECGSILDLLVAEVRNSRPGSGSVACRLADLLFVQAVRAYLLIQPIAEVSWCRGMQDARLGRALAVIHDQPEKSWTVDGLAAVAGMSRARFASRFHELVGETPISYLTNWRMHRAGRELTASHKTLAEISFEHGYTSDIAFSKAFKRWSGLLPRDYRRTTSAWPSAGEAASSSLPATGAGSRPEAMQTRLSPSNAEITRLGDDHVLLR